MVVTRLPVPNEIADEIILAASASAQVALCRTSRLYYALALPHLYHVVGLVDVASVESFCSTVLANPAKFAGLVRSFTVAITDAPKSPADDSFSRKLSNCCHALKRIENLSLDGNYLSKARQQLLSGTFPHLVRCTLSPARDGWTSTRQKDTMASFLIRHSDLQSISIQKLPGPLFASWPSTSPRIPMQNLQYLRAPAKFLSSIRDARLEEVRLSWTLFDSVGATFATLKSLISNDAPFISCICWGPHCESIVNSISEHIPHTRTLQLDVTVMGTRDELFERLKGCLHCLTSLAFFSLFRTRYPNDEGGEDETEAEIWPLLGVCPTLQAFRFGARAWRKVYGAWEMSSVDDFFVMAGITPLD